MIFKSGLAVLSVCLSLAPGWAVAVEAVIPRAARLPPVQVRFLPPRIAGAPRIWTTALPSSLNTPRLLLPETSVLVAESLNLPGLRKDAPAESSKGAAAQLFASVNGERLISPSIDDARSALADLFEGREYLAYQGADVEGQLAPLRRRAAALPGRSLIYLEAPTSAGKSTLADNLKTALAGRVEIFPVDNYFKAIVDVPPGKNGKPDFDRPGALNLEQAGADIKALLAGKKVELPRNDMKTGTVVVHSGEFLELGRDEVLIVDSIYAAQSQLLEAGAGHSALNVFLYAPAVVRLARRIARDRAQRGVSAAYNLTAWPHILEDEKDYILPLHERADRIINLTGRDELLRLPETYAGLLADEWAAEGKTARVTGLFRDDIKASLAADRESAAELLGVPAR